MSDRFPVRIGESHVQAANNMVVLCKKFRGGQSQEYPLELQEFDQWLLLANVRLSAPEAFCLFMLHAAANESASGSVVISYYEIGRSSYKATRRTVDSEEHAMIVGKAIIYKLSRLHAISIVESCKDAGNVDSKKRKLLIHTLRWVLPEKKYLELQ